MKKRLVTLLVGSLLSLGVVGHFVSSGTLEAKADYSGASPYTINLDNKSLADSTSYVATETTTKINGIDLVWYYLNPSNGQMKVGDFYIYNKDPMPAKITSIVVTKTNGNWSDPHAKVGTSAFTSDPDSSGVTKNSVDGSDWIWNFTTDNAYYFSFYFGSGDGSAACRASTIKIYFEDPVSSIEIDSTSTHQTNFYQGDTFTYSGLKVNAIHASSAKSTLTVVDDYTVSTPDMSTTGVKTVTITPTLAGKAAGADAISYDITVNPPRVLNSVTISGSLDLTSYKVGDPWDLSGLEVIGNWSTGDESLGTVNSLITANQLTLTLTPSTATLGVTSFTISNIVYNNSVNGSDFNVTGVTVSDLVRFELVNTIEDGNYVIADTNNYAIKNERYNNKDEKIIAVAVEVTETLIYEPVDTVIWTISEVETGYYTIYNTSVSKYISFVSGNNIKLSSTATTDNEKWSFAYDEGFKIKNKTQSTSNYYLQKNSPGAFFGYYLGSATGPLSLYKEVEPAIDVSVSKTTLGLGSSANLTATPIHGASGIPSYSVTSGNSYINLIDNGDGTAKVSSVSAGSAQVTVSLVGCDDVVINFTVVDIALIESIVVKTQPTKVNYTVGETFDPAGLSIDVTYSDSTELVPHVENKTSGFSLDTPDMSIKGTKVITVTYTENEVSQTTTFEIIVSYPELTVTEAITIAKALADNTNTDEYYRIVGKVAAIDGKNVDIAESYSEKDPEKLFRLYQVDNSIVSELMIGMNVSAESKIKKYVTSTKTLYETLSNPYVEYDPDVEKLVTGIEIYRSPDKNKYYVGDTELDLSGLKVKLHYNDSSKSDAIVYDDDPTAFEAMFTVTGFDTSTDGRKYLRITHNETGVYHDNDYEFSVYVNLVEPSSLDIVTKPTKTTYESGDEFDPAGIKVELMYNNGDKEDVTNSENLTYITSSGDGKVYQGDTSVTVKYTYDTDKFITVGIAISVNDAIPSYLVANPGTGYHKNTYDVGESVSVKSLTMDLYYSDGTHEHFAHSGNVERDDFKYEYPDMSTPGEKTVKITHKESGISTTYTIYVIGIDHIEILTEPYRVVYRTGDDLDLHGLTFKVYNIGKDDEVIDYDDVKTYTDVTGDTSKDGPDQTVSITYKGATASFNIDVWLSDSDLDSLITAQIKDLRDIYVEEDYSADNWLLVKGYIDEAEETLSTFVASHEGNHYTSDVMAVINAAIAKISEVPTIDLKGIKVTQKPTKTVYEVGDEFDPTGMVVVAQYKNKDDEVLSSEDYTISGFDSSVAGYSTVVITYQGKTDSFNVTIKNKEVKTLESIEVTHLPDKDAYVVGEEFDATGLVVVAHYSNGTEEIITTYSLSGFDSSTVGEKTINVTYENKETSFKVTVVASEEEKELANAKAQAKQQIENYYNSLDLDSLDEATRNKLLQAKQAALDAIDAATSVEEVNTAVTNGKAAMDKIIEDASKKTKPSSTINLPLVLGLSIGGGVLLVGGALFGLFLYLKKKKPTVNPGE